ncbi:TetR/AcrR family transcriptional regulator [Actinomycetes bacterium KLBMP 9759]
MSSPKSRRELYSEATRAALLETATEMFTERGFTAVSLDEIATATQVTRGAVYHHFDSKKALFEAVLAVLEIRMTEEVLAEAAKVEDPWESAITALDTFLDQCRDRTYGRVCWLEGPVALGWARWMEVEKAHAFGLVENFLNVLVAAGLVRPLPVDTAAQLIFNLLGGAGRVIAEGSDAEKVRLRDECSTLMRRMLEGLRVR